MKPDHDADARVARKIAGGFYCAPMTYEMTVALGDIIIEALRAVREAERDKLLASVKEYGATGRMIVANIRKATPA